MSNQLLLKVRESAGSAADVAVDFDDYATVGELSERLAAFLSHESLGVAGAPPILSVIGRHVRPFHPSEKVHDVDLRSGDEVAIRLEPHVAADRDRPISPGHIQFADGSQVPLRAGVNLVGRGPDVDVDLDDDEVSRLHASLTVGSLITVADHGSTNGTRVNGTLIQRPTAVGSRDVVKIGLTQFTTELVIPTSVEPGVRIEFNRPPRIFPRYEGREFEIPAPPSDPPRQRMPVLSALAPLVLAGVMWLLTKSLFSVIFMGLSPIMLFASYWESKRGARANHAAAVAKWRSKIEALREEIRVEHATEIERRHLEGPSLGQTMRNVTDRTPGLWDRAPEHVDNLHLRVGLADQASRINIKLADGGSDTYRTEIHGLPDEYGLSPQVPYMADVVSGGIGVCGDVSVASDVARAAVAQAVALHSPADLAVWAIVGPETQAEWDWLKWLPHVDLQSGGSTLAATAGGIQGLLERLADQIAESDGEGQRDHRHLLVVDDEAEVSRSRLAPILEAPSVSFVWIGRTFGGMPRQSKTVIQINQADHSAEVADSDIGRVTRPLQSDRMSREQARELASRLAPVVDSSDAGSVAELPGMVSVPDLLGGGGVLTDERVVLDNWNVSRLSCRPATRDHKANPALRAAVGRTGESQLSIDIRGDGPHALVAGTTGSGKSELLQSWVLAMAATHPPERVNFLFVDYKGGAAFKECIDLPHSVGLVTDLDPFQVRRALTSLNAEVHEREKLLNRKENKDAKNIIDLEQKGYADTPANLLIIVDEFAALASEVPEFVDGVVDIAQRGRSLGLHLILATQRPQGVIKDNIRANTNLRIALRMADESESSDVLGSPIAARFHRRTPGRAAMRVGATEPVLFQSGFAGATTPPPQHADRVSVAHLPFGAVAFERTEGAIAGDNDITRLVRTIKTGHAAEKRPDPPRPWLDPLKDLIDIRTLDASTDTRIEIGTRDVPRSQTTEPLALNPEREGSYLVLGTSGSGKTGTLRAVAAALAWCPDDVMVYGIDASGRGLKMLEALPMVGSTIAGGDTERVLRLLRLLDVENERRAELLSQHKVDSLSELRSAAGVAERRIFVLVDGLAALIESLDPLDAGRWVSLLPRMIAEGRQTGIHFVMTNTRRLGLRSDLTANITRILTLRTATTDEAAEAGVERDFFSLDTPPGRGFDQGLEVQIAIPSGTSDVTAQAEFFDATARIQRKSGVNPAPPVGRLDNWFGYRATATISDCAIGVADDTLEPVDLDSTERTFAVFGPKSSGKTSALTTMALAKRAGSDIPIVGASARGSLLKEPFDELAVGAEASVKLLDKILADNTAVALFVDDILDMMDAGLSPRIADLVKRLRASDGMIAVAADSALGRSSWDDAMKEIRTAKNGLVLVPDVGYDGDLFNTPLPRSHGRSFPPGRGFWIASGHPRLIQMADPSEVPPA